MCTLPNYFITFVININQLSNIKLRLLPRKIIKDILETYLNTAKRVEDFGIRSAVFSKEDPIENLKELYRLAKK